MLQLLPERKEVTDIGFIKKLCHFGDNELAVTRYRHASKAGAIFPAVFARRRTGSWYRVFVWSRRRVAQLAWL